MHTYLHLDLNIYIYISILNTHIAFGTGFRLFSIFSTNLVSQFLISMTDEESGGDKNQRSRNNQQQEVF